MAHEMRIAAEQPLVGADITGTSDAIEMASAPDIALPLETERAGTPAPALDWIVTLRDRMHANPGAAFAAAAAAGLLLGIALKKSFPAKRGI